MPKLASSPGQPPNSLNAQRAFLNKLYQKPAYQPPPPVDLTQFRQQPLPPVPYSDPATPPPPQATPPKAAIPKTAPPVPPPTTPVNVPPSASPGAFTQIPKPATGAPPGSGAAAGGAIATTSGGVVSTIFKFANTPAGFLGLVATGLLLHDARQLYKLVKLSQPESQPQQRTIPFTGGQEEDTEYNFSYVITIDQFVTGGQYGSGQRIPYLAPVTYTGTAFGKIGGIRIVGSDGKEATNFSGFSVEIYCKQTNHSRTVLRRSYGYDWHPTGSAGGPPFVAEVANFRVSKANNQPDTGGNLPEPTTLRRAPVKSASNDPDLNQSKQPNNLPPPTQSPAPPPPADQTFQQNNRVPVTIVTPGGSPITIKTPSGGSATFTPPNGNPNIIRVPRPRPIATPDFTSPAPTTAPPPPEPIKINTPDAPSPATFTFPGTEPITINFPGAAPIVINPVGNPPAVTGGTPTGDRPSAFVPTPTTTPPTTAPPTTTPDLDNPFKDIKDPDLQALGLGLVGITQLIKGIQGNTTPTAIANAVAPTIAPGVCKTTQPGGCTTNAMNNAVNQGNQDLLNKLGLGAQAGAQGVDLLLLNTINNKLGSQITGGLSGGLGRLSKFLGIDRIFNLLNFLATLHNASMLSASLKVTLLEMLSSVGNATGLLETSEGDNVDLNQVFNRGIETFLISLLGAETYAGLKVELRKYNAIYRAATNSLNAITSMFNSIGNALETIGEYSGKIGNALRAAGAVHENAYQSFAEKIDARGSRWMRFETRVGQTTEILEAINEIAENVVEGQQQYTEAVKATKEFKETLEKAEKNKGQENKAIAEELKRQKENATKDPTGEDEKGLLSFLTDL